MITGRIHPSDYIYADLAGDGILSMVLAGSINPESGIATYPVALTTKVLSEKCGFTLSSRGDGGLYRDGCISIVRTFIPSGSWVLCYSGVKIVVDSLHDLQNAWHVLFRKELEIK